MASSSLTPGEKTQSKKEGNSVGKLIVLRSLVENRPVIETMSEVYRNTMEQNDWSPAEAKERLRNAYILIISGLSDRGNLSNPFLVHVHNWLQANAHELGDLFDLLGVDVTKKTKKGA